MNLTPAATSASKDEPEVQTNDDQEISTTSSRDTTTQSPGLCSMVLPVWLSSDDDPSREVLVYALLDSMSDTTFINDATPKKLNARGQSTALKLTTMTSENETLTVSCSKICMSGV